MVSLRVANLRYNLKVASWYIHFETGKNDTFKLYCVLYKLMSLLMAYTCLGMSMKGLQIFPSVSVPHSTMLLFVGNVGLYSTY